MFFSHREFDKILDRYEQGKPFFLYTGRGPSSDSMHLGHMIPLSSRTLLDDEKFLFKHELKPEQTRKFATQNARDIIAVGFDLEKTFIFSDFDFVGDLSIRMCRRSLGRLLAVKPSLRSGLQTRVSFTLSQLRVLMDHNRDNIGKIHFAAIQAAPSFSNSFPNIFGTASNIPSLIPCAIDQDPYFRLTRDVAVKLKYPKPSLIHSIFFPALQGPQTKMSASDPNSSIFMSDPPNQIKNKINRHGFSGGKETEEEHRRLGGDTEVDVAYQYLTFFLDDDEELDKIGEEYRAGRMLTGQLKAKCISVLQAFVKDFQEVTYTGQGARVSRAMPLPSFEEFIFTQSPARRLGFRLSSMVPDPSSEHIVTSEAPRTCHCEQNCALIVR
ncbi:tryptophan--tRNA ligase [Salix suchowensis]|nr:tryptophan--tRNA ligase [Salix suchowensis]